MPLHPCLSLFATFWTSIKNADHACCSFLNLETVPSSLLRPLRSLTKKPTLERAFLSGDVFFSTEPYLRLMLGCNQLKTISPEILNLVHLHLLSLQHNDIQEVPEAIKNLKELQVLDIGGNRLQCLPWGVMKLIENGRLQHIAAHPNPWIELSDIQETDIEQWFCDVVDGLFFVKNRNKASERTSQTEKQDPESKYSESAPILVARGEKRYLDPEGNSLRSRTARKTPTHTESQYTKSLLEVALKGCTNAPDVIEAFEAMSEGKRERPNKRQSFRGSSEAIDNDNASLSDSPDNDDSDFDSDYFTVPDIIMPLLDLAKYSREFGENTCSICGRTFVIPRVEWIEWWDCSPQESYMKSKRKPENPLFPLPFLRKGCSWLCVADDTRHH